MSPTSGTRACKVVGRLRRWPSAKRLGIHGWPECSMPAMESGLERAVEHVYAAGEERLTDQNHSVSRPPSSYGAEHGSAKRGGPAHDRPTTSSRLSSSSQSSRKHGPGLVSAFLADYGELPFKALAAIAQSQPPLGLDTTPQLPSAHKSDGVPDQRRQSVPVKRLVRNQPPAICLQQRKEVAQARIASE